MSLFNAVHYVPTYNSIPFGHNSRKDFYSWAGIWYSVKCNNLCCSSVLKWTISKCHSQSLHFYFLPSRSLSFVLPFPPFFLFHQKVIISLLHATVILISITFIITNNNHFSFSFLILPPCLAPSFFLLQTSQLHKVAAFSDSTRHLLFT